MGLGKDLIKKVRSLENDKESLEELNQSLYREIDNLRSENNKCLDKVKELTNKLGSSHKDAKTTKNNERSIPPRFPLPDERNSFTHHFKIGAFTDLGSGYLTVGFYPDTTDVGELFIQMKKASDPVCPSNDPEVVALHREVSDLSAFLRGVLDQLAIAVSIGLQYGIPLNVYTNKFKNVRFPPDGVTKNKSIPFASSIIDYIFRYLEKKFVKDNEE